VSRPASLALYAAAARAVSPLAPAILRGRARRGKEDPARLGERLGVASVARPNGPLVWLHGASVGEGLSLLPLVARLRDEALEVALLVTSGTRTSAEVLAARLPAGVVHQFAPVDTPGAAVRFIGHWRPSLGVFVESELWPNLIGEAKASGARLALVSAKMSEGSFRGWRRFPRAAAAVLGRFDLILARDDAGSARFRALGARVDGVWDAKLGAPPLPADPAALAMLRDALAGREVILAASTHPGEEGPIARAFAEATRDRPAALLVIVPRHPVRGPEVEALVRAEGLAAARRSAGEAPAGAAVYVADTLGELGLFFRLARLAFIGGSLVEGVGGHNPLEPARLDCPFVAGPHTDHWPVYSAFLDAKATRRLEMANDLAAAIGDALGGALTSMATRAADVVTRLDADNQALAPRLLALIER
jgi:3-deoxy-D-manno-octulosonic-acid transferase